MSVAKFLLLTLLCLAYISGYSQTTISGYVNDKESGEELLFATVFVEGTTIGVTSNEYGFYSLTIADDVAKGDSIEITFGFVGYKNITKKVAVGSSSTLNVHLPSESTELESFVVKASRTKQDEELRSTQMSVIKIPMKQITAIPSLGGETDVIKVVQLLPGVARGGEGTTGMFVRGGDADQNLVLLDEATVYNTGHLFGFFSVFNADAIKDMTMIKGAFPANYGGRLSSILDIRMKDGHEKKIHGQGGIGLLSSRLTIEGPLKKDTSSFLISGRRTYIDKVFSLANVFIPYYFYDVNAKFNYKFSDKDRLFYSFYLGSDVLKFDGSDVDDPEAEEQGLGFGFTLGNMTNTVRWNHVYNPKLFSNLSLISTSFNYNINGKLAGNNLLIKSNIFDLGAKMDFDYYKSSKTHIKFGGSMINHAFKPNIINTSGEITEFLASSEGEKLAIQEMGVYGNADFDLVGEKLKMSSGLRLSGTNVKGGFYTGIEPRLSFRYMLADNDALKIGYSRMKQYMHRVSSSTVTLPTDLWYPVTSTIKPQAAEQIAIGYHHLFKEIKTSLTVEGYYKWLNNLIEYREGANLILNNNFENELLQGTGDAYGAEVLLKKDEGRFTGWIGYTLAWATRDFDELNGGETFPAKYDRRHNISIVGTYQLSERWTVSAVWVFSNGSRFTAQIGQYLMPNATLTGVDIIPLYTKRNEVSMSSSHRMDINFVLKPKEDKKFKGEWHFGCYNLYNRATPYRVDVQPVDENGTIGYKYVQPGLFGFIPSIAYNFSF
jgi:hypothetical protein